jgi:magnesium-transporting ATPase (P-type)
MERGEDIQWLLQALQTQEKRGISTDELAIQRRKAAFGTNEKQAQEPPGFFKLFCEALEDFILRILLVAACLSIAIETGTADDHERPKAWIEGFAILVAVFVCALVTAANDYQKERQFLQLNSVADEKKKVSVRRDGLPMEIHQDFVLAGDVVSIN